MYLKTTHNQTWGDELQNGQTQKGDFKENKKKNDILQKKTTGLSVGVVAEPRIPCKIFKAKEQALSTKHNAHLLLRRVGDKILK